jgi:ABC-2 type transport system ATP-binding protein
VIKERVLVFETVTKRYGARAVLSDLSFSLPPSVIGLVGPNGAGKSTLMKIVLGFLPFDGRVRVLDLDPRTQAIELRARIGYMPERDGLPTGMNAVALCTLAGELCGLLPNAAIERAHATLGFVGLGDKRYLPVDGYSTGMKQRVRLALALVHGPQLLLLDEPTNGLDPQGREEMLALIAEIPRRAGASVILSSHLLPDIETVCDRALILADGKLVFAGTLQKLKGDDAGPRRWELRVKGDDGAFVAALERDGYGVARDGALLYVTATREPSTRPIFSLARQHGVQVRHLQAARRGLEAAFLAAIGEEARG